MIDSDRTITLKELSYKAIAKHSRRIFKRESGVLLDQDPEDLHQMRVSVRRLRSAIASFDLALDLPEIVTGKNIAKIGHSLGKLRDLDVLLDVFNNSYRSQLPAKEQKILDRVIKSLNKQRQQELKRVRKTLNSSLYADLKQAINNWRSQPKYKTASDLAVDYVLPDLLLPQVSQFLLHPGWFVGIDWKHGKIKFPHILSMDAIEQILTREDVFLHDLRKSAKKTRYSLELFSQFYGDTYNNYLQQVAEIQEILGQIQDTHVLRKVLEKKLRSPISSKMPELASLLLQIRYQRWLEWQELQQQFLQEETREEFRQAMINRVRSQEYSTTNHDQTSCRH